MSDVVGKKQEGQLSYRFRPPPMMAADQSIPLVVFLHGSGERGDDNFQQLRIVPIELCAPLIVQLPLRNTCTTVPKEFFLELETLRRCCDFRLAGIYVRPGPADQILDPHRVYLIGYSMGGFGAWSWATHSPNRFAAVISIAGGGDPNTGSTFVDLPVWAVHGADDDVVSVEQTRAIIGAVREAGGTPRYSEVAGMGHDSWRELFDDDSAILRWLFSQKREQSVSSDLN